MTQPPAKRRRVADFIEHEASVAREEEDEEVAEEDNEFIQNDEEMSEEVSSNRYTDIMRQQDANRQERGNYLSQLESRYVRPQQRQDEDEEEVVDYRSSVPRPASSVHMPPPQSQQIRPSQHAMDKSLLIPTPKDPSLFLIKCRPGKEKEAALTIMQKFASYMHNPQKALLITGVVALDYLQGYIYIEAHRETHVKRAIEGVDLVFPGKIKMVPINEMTQVLDVSKETKVMPKRNDWVRMTRGLYKNDLARVLDVDESRGNATVEVVPRLRYPGQQDLRNQKVPKRLFNRQEIENKGGIVEEKRDIQAQDYTVYHYNGNKYSDAGFLHKTVNIKSLKTKNINPELDEIQWFSSSTNALPPSSFKNHEFKEGDSVRVVDGDLKDLTGTIHSVNKKDRTVEIFPDAPELKDQVLTVDANELTFNIDIGSFVQVTNGKHAGETGDVVAVKGNYVILYSREKNKEMEAFITDIKQVSHVTTNESYREYSLHDLVKLSGQSSCGVVIQVGNGSFKILDEKGTVKTYKYQELVGKLTKDNFSKKDSRGNFVGKNDNIKVVSGNHAGLEGVVKHVYRNYLFCHSRDLLENNGMFVTQPSHCEVKGGVSNNESRPNIPPNKTFFRPRIRTNKQGKTVRITKGSYKGYTGTVKGAGAKGSLRVELHSQFKVVNVDANQTKELDVSNKPRSIPRAPNATPHHFGSGSETPFNRHGESHTPLHTTQTPMHSGSYGEPATPGGLGGWDKRVPNTPRDVPESPFNPSYEGNNYRYSTTPGTTPGFNSSRGNIPATPGVPSQKPITPGNANNPPYQSNIHTPGAPVGQMGQRNPTTPGGMDNRMHTYSTPGVSTPGYNLGRQNPSTPGSNIQPPSNSSYYNPTTPGMGRPPPQTPGMNAGNFGRGIPSTPNHPVQTPGGYSGNVQNTVQRPQAQEQSWIVPNIEVKVAGQGVAQVIKSNGYKTMVRLLDTNQEIEVNSASLEPTRPQPNTDRVIVIKGQHTGKKGVISHIDDSDTDKSNLCVIHSEEGETLAFQMDVLAKLLQ